MKSFKKKESNLFEGKFSVIRLLPFMVVFILWWCLTSRLHLIPAYIISPPEVVLKNAVKLFEQGLLIDSIVSSISRMAGGFLIGSLAGIVLGILVATNKYYTFFMEPIAKFFQAVAGPTWIPLAILWFGMSYYAVSFIVFNTVFFIVFYNTLIGIETVNQTLVNSVRVLGGNKWIILKDVLIPGAIPSIIVGLRLGIGYGWRALIAGEMIASGQGLGVLIWEGQRLFRIYDIILGLVIIGLISYIMEKIFMRTIERRTIEKWRISKSEI